MQVSFCICLNHTILWCKALTFNHFQRSRFEIFHCNACRRSLCKMVMIILFCNINGRTWAGGGAARAFTIHIPLHDYIKRVFCRIWLMYLVFLKTRLKYENWQKWGHYKELSIFNNLLKRGKMKCRTQRSCSEIQ